MPSAAGAMVYKNGFNCAKPPVPSGWQGSQRRLANWGVITLSLTLQSGDWLYPLKPSDHVSEVHG